MLGVAEAPVASSIMACEMNSSYILLAPLMGLSTLSHLAMGKRSLYEKQ